MERGYRHRKAVGERVWSERVYINNINFHKSQASKSRTEEMRGTGRDGELIFLYAKEHSILSKEPDQSCCEIV